MPVLKLNRAFINAFNKALKKANIEDFRLSPLITTKIQLQTRVSPRRWATNLVIDASEINDGMLDTLDALGLTTELRHLFDKVLQMPTTVVSGSPRKMQMRYQQMLNRKNLRTEAFNQQHQENLELLRQKQSNPQIQSEFDAIDNSLVNLAFRNLPLTALEPLQWDYAKLAKLNKERLDIVMGTKGSGWKRANEIDNIVLPKLLLSIRQTLLNKQVSDKDINLIMDDLSKYLPSNNPLNLTLEDLFIQL